VKQKLNTNVLRIIAVVFGALVVLALGYFVLIKPQGAKLKQIKSQEDDARQTLAAYTQKVAAARSAPKIRVADVYRLAKAMPSQADMPDVLLELSQLARDTGIRFDSISPQPLVTLGSYSVLPISVTFNGTFYDLADLLYRLRSLVSVHAGTLDATGRLFAVDSLSFGESPLKFPRIQATLVIDAFIYGSAGAAATGVPATPPSATGTTSTTTSTDTTSTGTTTTSTTSTTTTPSTTASAAGAP
jgi:type IV pilus assembly protein PilO